MYRLTHLEAIYERVSKNEYPAELTREQIELALLLLDSHEWVVPVPPQLAHLQDEDWEALELALCVLQEEQAGQLH